MFSRFPLRTILIAAVIIMCLLAVLSWRSACTSADKARREASIAAATGNALDNVAAKTPEIRADQKQKEDAVEKIDGADAPLPDGFASSLERVRRQPTESRNP
jgi:Flp pilus assembly protein TadB